MTKPAEVPVFILAGGLGTRISEETNLRPKPMIEVGDIPILVHIMRWYYAHGFNDFVICGGYRSWEIKQYFLNYEFRVNHLLIDHREGGLSALTQKKKRVADIMGQNQAQERWRIRVIDTGLNCMTGGRIARAFDEIHGSDRFEHFAITYGDGVSDVPLGRELEFHLEHQRIGTVLGVTPLARFGELEVNSDGRVDGFLEKPEMNQGSINGGFFFMKRQFREFLSTDATCILERQPLATLAQRGELMMFKNPGFWHPMDTLRDKNYLQELWDKGNPPWLYRSGVSRS
ncbi:MAG: sugar phosphate nucleotidyltransferase [Bdellovibrionia bacterium]